MTRKTAYVTIDAEGRDKGKVFKLTEMPSAQSEKWAMRAFLAMAKGGVEVPDDIAESGLAGIAALGLKTIGLVPWQELEPLMDEMFACVQAVPDPHAPNTVTPLFAESIEEPATRLFLRKKIFGIHVDFSKLAALSTSASAASLPADSPTT